MGSVKDINVKVNDINFVCRSCAVIRNGDKVLFQKRKNDKYYSLPGGKIEVLETVKDALKRELIEELGVEVEVKDIVSVVENFFEFNNEKVHQYIFSYEVKLLDDKYNNLDEFEGIETLKEVIFKWFDIDELDEEFIKPNYLVKQLKSNEKSLFYTCIE